MFCYVIDYDYNLAVKANVMNQMQGKKKKKKNS